METIFTNDSLKVWHDGYSPIIFTRIESLPGPGYGHSLDSALTAITRLLKQFGRSKTKFYMLIDLASLQSWADDAFVDHLSRSNLFARCSKLDLVAIVLPQIPTCALHIRRQLNRIPQCKIDYNVAVSISFEIALKSINKKREQTKPHI